MFSVPKAGVTRKCLSRVPGPWRRYFVGVNPICRDSKILESFFPYSIGSGNSLRVLLVHVAAPKKLSLQATWTTGIPAARALSIQ